MTAWLLWRTRNGQAQWSEHPDAEAAERAAQVNMHARECGYTVVSDRAVCSWHGDGGRHQPTRAEEARLAEAAAAGRLITAAASFERDARSLTDSPPDETVLPAAERQYWITAYGIVAENLRKAAAGEPARPVLRAGDDPVATLSPDAVLLIDEPGCIVLATPERRIIVTDHQAWRAALGNAKIAQQTREVNA